VILTEKETSYEQNVLLECAASVEEDAVWTVFLPRVDPRKTQVRSSWLEHSVRIQRDRPENFRATAGNVPQPIRR